MPQPNYLLSFLIGSSWFVTLWFFLVVPDIPADVRNYSVKSYIVIAPLFLGLVNVLGEWLSYRFGWSLRQRMLLVGLLSPAIVTAFAYFMNAYNYTPEEWRKYAPSLFAKHWFIFNTIVWALHKQFNI